MGIFNFLKGKEKNSELLKSEKVVAPSSNKSLVVKGLTIHEDLKNLVWIGDGKYKNYTQEQNDSNSLEVDGIRISISFMNHEEPSLIYTSQRISQPSDVKGVERPSYYPTYSDLTPEQKWVYVKLLTNPYDASINIGFVFILYYGLERHLLGGNFEDAFEVILKLRDVHTNKSFQSYSANALVLSCMMHQRGDLVLKFIKSLDKDYELAFSDNLFLICYYSFDLPLLPKDIIRMARTFEFTNTNYIKKYPDLFLENIKSLILSKNGTEEVNLKKYLTATEIKKVKQQEVGIFANMSIIEKSISIPFLSENFKLKRELYNFLETAHENVKIKIKEMRKSGKTLPVNKVSSKPKKKIEFDQRQEREFLDYLSQNKNDPVMRHFAYIQLHDFYYKFRSLGDDYLNECIKYCFLDLNSLSELHEGYIKKQIKMSEYLITLHGQEYFEEEKARIRKEGFIGRIPGFNRLAIIYEKQSKFDEAIDICNRAIEYGQATQEFEEKIRKLEKKKNS